MLLLVLRSLFLHFYLKYFRRGMLHPSGVEAVAD